MDGVKAVPVTTLGELKQALASLGSEYDGAKVRVCAENPLYTKQGKGARSVAAVLGDLAIIKVYEKDLVILTGRDS